MTPDQDFSVADIKRCARYSHVIYYWTEAGSHRFL